jgi:hypothetical protein
VKNSEGYELKAAHVPSSMGDFASLRVERAGCLSIGVYPLTAAELRQLSSELLACAATLEQSERDNARLDQINAQLMWEAAA